MKCGAEEILTQADGNGKWCKHLGKLQLKIFIPYDLRHHFLGINLEKCVCKCTRKHTYNIDKQLYNSFVPNCPKLEATEVSIKRGMHK